MKIMMITAADSIHAVRWANSFIERGHQVDFVTLADHGPRGDSFSEKINIHYLRFAGSKGYILNAFELNHLWKSLKPDVVNVHYASGYGLLVRLARLKKVVLSVWGSDVYDFPDKNKLAHRIVTKNILYADAVASTSHCMAKQVEHLIGNTEREITITPFGVDVDIFKSLDKEDNDIAKNTFTFGTIKKLTYKYGIDYIINAFAIVFDKYKKMGANNYPEPRLFICGKGENRENFERLRDELGLHDHIIIEGYIPHDKIPKFMNRIDVFCLGSISSSESFGVAAVEAMACEIPIVATDVDGFKEVLIDKQTGYIVPKKDAKAMAEKMWELYLDEDKRRRFGVNGRQHVLNKYVWDDNVNALLTLLGKVSKKGERQ